MSSKDKQNNRRLRTSSVSTVISISLVLFMLGVIGLIIMTSGKLSDAVKENIGFAVYFRDNAKEVDVLQMQKFMESSPYVKRAEYISKEAAVKMLREELDPTEDFVSFLNGHNPLPASINVILRAEYTHPDSIAGIEKELAGKEFVREVVYSKSLVEKVNKNVKLISLIILAFSALLFIVAVTLINNTIRLTIYSKRFLIKTMQLVGATHGFIRRPFILTGIGHGLVASLIAIAMLAGLLLLVGDKIPEIAEFYDSEIISIIFGSVVIVGLFISWISTLLAVRRFLLLRAEDLH